MRCQPTYRAALELGFVTDDGKPNTRVFLELRKDKTFPQPVITRGHHLWWDVKAIHRYLDNKGKIEPDSEDFDAKVRERARRIKQRGNGQSEIRC